MKTLASTPEMIARFTQIPRGQENRLQTLVLPHGPMVNSADKMAANVKH